MNDGGLEEWWIWFADSFLPRQILTMKVISQRDGAEGLNIVCWFLTEMIYMILVPGYHLCPRVIHSASRPDRMRAVIWLSGNHSELSCNLVGAGNMCPRFIPKAKAQFVDCDEHRTGSCLVDEARSKLHVLHVDNHRMRAKGCAVWLSLRSSQTRYCRMVVHFRYGKWG